METAERAADEQTGKRENPPAWVRPRTCSDSFLPRPREYRTIEDGSPMNLARWKQLSSGSLNRRIFSAMLTVGGLLAVPSVTVTLSKVEVFKSVLLWAVTARPI